MFGNGLNILEQVFHHAWFTPSSLPKCFLGPHSSGSCGISIVSALTMHHLLTFQFVQDGLDKSANCSCFHVDLQLPSAHIVDTMTRTPREKPTCSHFS